MLERVWGKGNPLTLWVGMQTSTATMENSVENFLKPGNRTAIMTQQYHFWAHPLRKADLKETHAPQCSSQHSLPQPGHGSNPDAHQQTNG